MNSFLFGAITAGGIILIVVAILGTISLVKTMVANDIIFTSVEEGQAKAILRFGQLERMVMAYGGHRFKLGDRKGYDRWEIEEDSDPKIPFLGGVRIVGIPFVHTVHKQRFNWTSLEQKPTENGGTEDKPVTVENKDMAHILVQEDVYVSEINGAETKELVPVTLLLLLTIRIVNPAKARFIINHWLETTHNQIRPVIRGYIGTQSFSELIAKSGDEKAIEAELGLPSGDQKNYSKIALDLKDQYGVLIKKVQVHKIDQSKVEDVNLVELATKKYAAERREEETQIDARAEAGRIETVYGKIQKYGPLGQNIVALETLAKTKSNIFVGTEGGGLSKALIIGDTTKDKGGQ